MFTSGSQRALYPQATISRLRNIASVVPSRWTALPEFSWLPSRAGYLVGVVRPHSVYPLGTLRIVSVRKNYPAWLFSFVSVGEPYTSKTWICVARVLAGSRSARLGSTSLIPRLRLTLLLRFGIPPEIATPEQARIAPYYHTSYTHLYVTVYMD